MPTDASIPTEWVLFEDGSGYLMSRITGNAGTVITAATISSITAHCYNLTDTATDTLNATLTPVSSYVYDTPQTTALDPRWPSTAHASGYTFGYVVPGMAIPDGGASYQLEVLLTPTSGEVIRIARAIATIPMYSS